MFCTFCGAHQGTIGDLASRKSRTSHYAAHPGEHVAHPSFFTTLFPHLGHGKLHDFRIAFVFGAIVVGILVVAGFVTAAIIASAFLVPALYVLYIYEAQVYRDAPASVVGLTFGGGIVLGLLVTLVVRALTSGLPAARAVTLGGVEINYSSLAALAILVPLVQEAVKVLPALALKNRLAFAETADGLVFGVASGLGFALAETLVNFGPVLTSTDARTDPSGWIFTMVSLAVLLPIMQGSTTGVIAVSIWRMGKGGLLVLAGPLAALLAHAALVGGTQLIQAWGQSQLVWLAWQTLIVGALLIYIRYLLHHALLDEASHLGMVETRCPNCHRHVYAAGFCPSCGKALTVGSGGAVSAAPATVVEGA
jgi:RsiW-degrading membrane proteinase PrsW (M82 family)